MANSASGIEPTDFIDMTLCELESAIIGTEDSSELRCIHQAFSDIVPDVIGLGAQEEMRGLDARWLRTFPKCLLTGRNSPTVHLPRHSGCCHNRPADIHHAKLPTSATPQPMTLLLGNFCQKPILKRWPLIVSNSAKSPAPDRISGILFSRSEKQVVWPDTWRIVATMADHHAMWNWAFEQFIGDSMGSHRSSFVLELPIPIMCSEQPTGFGLPNLRHKAGLGWDSSPNASMIEPTTLDGISNIVPLASEPKMPRLNTPTVISSGTGVQNIVSFWNPSAPR